MLLDGLQGYPIPDGFLVQWRIRQMVIAVGQFSIFQIASNLQRLSGFF